MGCRGAVSRNINQHTEECIQQSQRYFSEIRMKKVIKALEEADESLYKDYK